MTAILRMSSRSKVAAQDGPEGNDVEQRPALVQLDIMEEWMQLEPLVVGQSFGAEREKVLIWGAHSPVVRGHAQLRQRFAALVPEMTTRS